MTSQSNLRRIVAAVIERVAGEHRGANLDDLNQALDSAYPFAYADSMELREVWRQEIANYMWSYGVAFRRKSTHRLTDTGETVH